MIAMLTPKVYPPFYENSYLPYSVTCLTSTLHKNQSESKNGIHFAVRPTVLKIAMLTPNLNPTFLETLYLPYSVTCLTSTLN